MLGTTTATNNSSSQTNNNMNLVICSTTTTTNYQQYWPQNQQIIDEKKSNNNSSSSTLIMASSSPPILMEKSNPQQQQELHQQQSLKCPRCDSSNTKFCYYNNYSLSQPRHFCKACKRYWTRGGTLRNVPVGGGCRKNKRLNNKRPTPSSISTLDNNSPNSSSSNPNPNSSNPIINTPPLFYGLPTTTTTDPTHLNLPYQNFNSRVSVSGYGGLGFSSGLMDYSSPGGFNPKEIQEVVNSSTSLLSRYPIFGSTNLLQQQKFMGGLVPYEDMQMMGGTGSTNDVKEVKMEDSQNRLNWSSLSTQMDQIGSSDPSLLWLDPSNIGPSIPSLI